jgi:hypothetical protein
MSGLLTIFFSPADTFANQPKARGWLVPMVAAALAALVMNAVIVNRIGIGTIVRNQLESSARLSGQLGADGINQAVARAENSTVQRVMSLAGAPIGVTLILTVMAGITLGLLLAAGGSTRYSAVLTSGAWTMYAVLAVTCAGSIIAVYAMTDFTGVDMQSLFALNAGIFFRDGNPVVRALMSGIDLLAFWGIFLNTIGITRLSERVSTGVALGVLVAIHVVATGIRAGWAAMFG